MKPSNNVASMATEAIVNHPKTALIVPAVTSIFGSVSAMAELQGWLTIISMFIGIVVSLVLLRHRWLALQLLEIEHRTEKLRLEEDIRNEKIKKASIDSLLEDSTK